MTYYPIIKAIPDFPRYQISEYGQIYMKRTQNEIKSHINAKGYIKCNLRMEDKNHLVSVHRILASVFIPNPNNYVCVAHKDKNKLNNSLDNLYWTTYSLNNRKRSICKNNTSGKTGVKLSKGKVMYWCAQIYDYNHKRIQRYFSHNPKGFEEAIAWRKEKEVEYGYL